jgi:hypothetical protein
MEARHPERQDTLRTGAGLGKLIQANNGRGPSAVSSTEPIIAAAHIDLSLLPAERREERLTIKLGNGYSRSVKEEV